MLKRIGKFIFNYQLTRKIAYANKLKQLTGYKYLVFYTGRSFKIIAKKSLKQLLNTTSFKGLNIQDLERRALYVTNG